MNTLLINVLLFLTETLNHFIFTLECNIQTQKVMSNQTISYNLDLCLWRRTKLVEMPYDPIYLLYITQGSSIDMS